MITPNGIGLSPDGGTLYFAETEAARLWAFEILAPGVVRTLPFPASPPGPLRRQPRGAAPLRQPGGGGQRQHLRRHADHRRVAVFSPAGELLRQVSMADHFTTNICFGGPDMRTAYVTLSGTGMLAAMDWPEPGLRLNYQD